MANDTAPVPHAQQFEEARAAGIAKGEALKGALAGINNKAMKAAIKAACDEVYARRDAVWTPAQLEAQLAESRKEWGDRHADRMAPYLTELRGRMALAASGPVEALVVALDGVESPAVRRDLCAAAALLLLEGGASELPDAPEAIPAPPYSAKAAAWVKDIGKNGTIWRLAGGTGRPAVFFDRRLGAGAPSERRVGWCLLDEPLQMEAGAWSSERLHVGELICAGWRVDTVKLPAKRIKIETTRRVRSWCAENRREKAPAKIVAEIEEIVTSEILATMTPETKIVPVVIDEKAGAMLAFGAGVKEADEIGNALRGAGVSLVGALAEDVVGPELTEALGLTQPDDLRLDVCPSPHTGRAEAIGEHSHREFLLWLWWRAQASGGTATILGGTPGEVSWWMDAPISLSREGGDFGACTVTVGGADAESCAAGLASLAEGYTPIRVRIGVRVPVLSADEGEPVKEREHRDYHATLEGWDAKAVGLPGTVIIAEEDDLPGAVFERVELYRECCRARDALFLAFAQVRADPERWGRARECMREWIGLELARKFITDDTGKQGLLFGACQRLIPVRED